jgi:hypothetical protein
VLLMLLLSARRNAHGNWRLNVETPNTIAAHADAWQVHADANKIGVTAVKAPAGDNTLRSYIQPTRPADPAHTTIPGNSNLPESDPNRILEINRSTAVVRPDGKQFTNPWGITPTPITPKQAPKASPTVAEVQAGISQLRDELTNVPDEYAAAQADDVARHERLIAIGKRLDILMPEVAALQDELTDLRARPTADALLISQVTSYELQAQKLAGDGMVAVAEAKCRQSFGATLKEVSAQIRQSILSGVKAFKDFSSPYAARFSRSQTKSVPAAQETVERLVTSLDVVSDLIKTRSI